MSNISIRAVFIAIGALLLVACSNGEPAVEPESTLSETTVATATPAPTATPEPTATPAPTATPEPTSTAEAVSQTSAFSVDTSVDTSEEAQEIFLASLTAIARVDSFRFETDAVLDASDGGIASLIPITLTGEFQSPDRMHGKMTISLGFFSLEVETIAIGEVVYTRDFQDGKWEIVDNSSLVFLDPSELARAALPTIGNLTSLGEELLDGTLTHHLRGVLGEDVFGSSSGDATVDYWIDVEDSLMRQIFVKGDVALEDAGLPIGGAISGDVTLEMTMTFSDYGSGIVIEPPDLN